MNMKKGCCDMKTGNEKGFTLVELLIVLVILTILVTLAMPNLGMVFTKNKLQGSTSQVMSSLYLARMKAVNDAEPYGVKFNMTDPGDINIIRDPLGDNEVRGATSRLDDGIEFAEITFVNNLVIFNEFGQLDKNCLPSGILTGTIIITDGLEDSTRVDITRLTGRIRETDL